MKPLVLVVEDESAQLAMLRYNLEKGGFSVCTADNGEEALAQIAERQPDAILLDWVLPFVSGIEVCRRIRSNPKLRNLPVLMLTARANESDRVRGLDNGADDYIVKPFSPIELIARLRAVMRRFQPANRQAGKSAGNNEVLRVADLSMDLAAHRVTRAGRPLHLGPTEFGLLRFLMQSPGRVFSREQLLDTVRDNDIFVQPRTIDVYVSRLRKALNTGGEVDLIRTVRAAGYALDTAPERSRPTPRVSRRDITGPGRS